MATDTIEVEVAGIRAHFPRGEVASWPRMVWGDKVYLSPWRGPIGLTVTCDGLRFEPQPAVVEATNRCEHCGRADLREKVIDSLEAALAEGLFVPCPEELL